VKDVSINNEIDKIVSFMKLQLSSSGFNKLIVGLSGGIDSAVTAALAVKAIGSENVHAVMLPYRLSHPNSLNHAKEVADKLNLKYEIIDISPMVDSYFDNYDKTADTLRRGNRMARERMCVLYDLSAKQRALVAGTGNLSELMIGYCTQYGDSACAFEPIGHLYKTHVFELAKALNLPDCVIDKRPTADLWEDQTDEDEMGITYPRLDEILYQKYELKKSYEEMTNLGIKQEELEKVTKMVKSSEFKRNMPPVPEVS